MDRLISEQAVIDVINGCLINRQTVIDKIKAIPSAEPKTGHWIKSMRHECTYSDSDDNKLYEYVIHYKCSLCGFETGTQAEYFDYCPECGARMVEPQESESDVQ